MNWKVYIYRKNQVAVIPINGAESAEEANRCAAEILKKFPKKLDFKTADKKGPDRIEVEQIG